MNVFALDFKVRVKFSVYHYANAIIYGKWIVTIVVRLSLVLRR